MNRQIQTNKKHVEVIMDKDIPLLPASTIDNTPSMKEGLDRETEAGMRWHGCKMIQNSCLLLRVTSPTLVTSQVIFHRYFYATSFVSCKLDVAALACTWLASKIEENRKLLDDVARVLLRMRQIRDKK